MEEKKHFLLCWNYRSNVNNKYWPLAIEKYLYQQLLLYYIKLVIFFFAGL